MQLMTLKLPFKRWDVYFISSLGQQPILKGIVRVQVSCFKDPEIFAFWYKEEPTFNNQMLRVLLPTFCDTKCIVSHWAGIPVVSQKWAIIRKSAQKPGTLWVHVQDKETGCLTLAEVPSVDT